MSISTATLLEPPTTSNPSHTLHLSQQAPLYLKTHSPSTTSILPWPLSLLFSPSESQEIWQIHENLLLATLRSGDISTASGLLTALETRFGLANERVAALRGLYAEATAKDEKELQEVLSDYEEVLKEDATAFSIRKRRVALLKTLGRKEEAFAALTNYLDSNATDAEGWREVGQWYAEEGKWDQAIFALEEGLLLTPNSWEGQARMGEVLAMSVGGKGVEAEVKGLAESTRRFARSVELCEWYLRGWFGLKVITGRLLEALGERKSVAIDTSAGELPLPSLDAVKKLNQLATSKLAGILRRSSSGEQGWDGFSEAELIAARALLDQDRQKLER